MSMASACAEAAVRGGAVAVVATALARPLSSLALNASGGAGRKALLWGLLAAPFLTPVILVGYAWFNFSLSLVHHPAWNEAFYALLLVFKLAPVAVLVMCFAPTHLTREAIHCRRLARGGGGLRDGLMFFIHGPALKSFVAGALVFFFAFGEFDMARLMNVDTWTAKLFDAQAGGLPIVESLRLVALPLAVEAALLLATMLLLFAGKGAPHLGGEKPRPLGPFGRGLCGLYLVAAVAVVTAIPLVIVLRGTLAGFSAIRFETLRDDVLTSVLYAAAGAAGAFGLSAWFTRRTAKSVWSKGRFVAAFLMSVPGLLGGLVLGLLLLGLFQVRPLLALRDTPVPVVLALMLLFLAFAMVLRALMDRARGAEGLHSAKMLLRAPERELRRSGAGLVWEMRTRTLLLVAALLFFWAYFEVAASSLLAPVGHTPVFVQLYNQMHYGRTAALSSMVCIVMIVPVIAAALVTAAGRAWVGWSGHG